MITQEFFDLGDHEQALGLHPSPLCNRATDTNIPASQLGFFKFICIPFYALVGLPQHRLIAIIRKNLYNRFTHLFCYIHVRLRI